jgi:hypothetical protein
MESWRAGGAGAILSSLLGIGSWFVSFAWDFSRDRSRVSRSRRLLSKISATRRSATNRRISSKYPATLAVLDPSMNLDETIVSLASGALT